MATPRKRGGDPAMEKLMAEALALEKARTAEQAGLLQMDKEAKSFCTRSISMGYPQKVDHKKNFLKSTGK